MIARDPLHLKRVVTLPVENLESYLHGYKCRTNKLSVASHCTQNEHLLFSTIVSKLAFRIFGFISSDGSMHGYATFLHDAPD